MRILFVGFAGSPHLVNNVNLLSETGWDVHVVSCLPGHEPALEYTHGTLYFSPHAIPADPPGGVTVRPLPVPAGSGGPPIRTGDLVSAIVHVIDEVRPDLVHTHQIQPAAYLTYEARERLGSAFPPWAVTNYGTDIDWFGRSPPHVERLKAILRACDYYWCECHRDVGLARAFGFQGRAVPVLPIAGGVDLDRARPLRSQGPTSQRRTIALKAYQHWYGRALIAVDALERCADALDGYEIAAFACAPVVQDRLEAFGRNAAIDVEIVSRHEERLGGVPHSDILRMHGRARASIGLGMTDGISTSFVEAMAMGSVPIQSNTGCAREWVEPGRDALFVEPEDVVAIEEALRRVVTDDAFVDEAVAANDRTVRRHLDRKLIRERVVDTYERIAVDIARHRDLA